MKEQETCRNCKYLPSERNVKLPYIKNGCEIEQYCTKGRFDVVNALDTAKCIHFERLEIEELFPPTLSWLFK